MPIKQEISDKLDYGRKPSQVISVVVFTSKIVKIAQDKCSHCVMALDGDLQWLLMVKASQMGKFSGTKFSQAKTLFLVPKQSFLPRN